MTIKETFICAGLLLLAGLCFWLSASSAHQAEKNQGDKLNEWTKCVIYFHVDVGLPVQQAHETCDRHEARNK